VPRLSIIIPVAGDLRDFENGLASVLQHRPDDCEIIVPLTVAYDDPYQLAEEVRLIDARRCTAWTQAVAVGLAAARSPVVHLLASGAEVTEGWTDAALRHFDDGRIAAVAPLVFDLADPQRLLSAGLEYGRGGVRRLRDRRPLGRAASIVLGPTRSAAFYRLDALLAIGGFCGAVGDALADVDLALSLERVGWRAIVEPRSVVYARQTDPAVTEFAGGLYAERLFRRHFPAYRDSRLGAALGHASLVLSELASCAIRPRRAMRLAGRMIAACQWLHYRRHRRLMGSLSAGLPAGSRLDPNQSAPPPPKHSELGTRIPGAEHASHSRSASA
jgi:hypothetical protein